MAIERVQLLSIRVKHHGEGRIPPGAWRAMYRGLAELRPLAAIQDPRLDAALDKPVDQLTDTEIANLNGLLAHLSAVDGLIAGLSEQK